MERAVRDTRPYRRTTGRVRLMRPCISIAMPRETFDEVERVALAEQRPFAAVARDLLNEALAARYDTAAPLPPKHMLDNKASPALYEALVALLDWMERVTTEGCHASVAAAAADKAHAALALARGDSQ